MKSNLAFDRDGKAHSKDDFFHSSHTEAPFQVLILMEHSLMMIQDHQRQRHSLPIHME